MDNKFISALWEILIFTGVGTGFILVTLFFSRLIRPKKPNDEKLTSYESGEDPVGNAWPQISGGYYIIALLFLLFEIEIVFLIPLAALSTNETLNHETHGKFLMILLIETGIFILVLALGLAYTWVNGHLDWMTPKPKPSDFKPIVPKEFYENFNKKYS